MSQDEINAILFRKIKSGLEFDRLIPKTTCQSTYVGDGMTDFSMKQMAEVVHEYSWQADLLADALERKSLQETVFAIHDFLYDHFQYRADKAKQFLRTLACSWYDRANGIDCKSYSIAASSILTALGIRHSIRRIKQAGFAPKEWTHVYVIVPKNQKTGNLNEGYYTIDGTIPEKDEPDYTEKNDLDMSLQHYVLNGAIQKQGLKGLNGVDLGSITGLFKKYDCIGGSGFTQGSYEQTQKNMIAYFDEVARDINNAILSKNDRNLSYDVNEFYAVAALCVQSYERKLSEGWNSCTTARINGMIAMSKFYRDIVGTAVQAYMTEYFIKTPAGTGPPYKNSETEHAPYNFNFTYTGNPVVVSMPLFNYAVKPGVSLPKFEITQAVINSAGSELDVFSFIKSLVTPLVSNNSGGTIPGATDGYYNQPGTGTVGNTTKQAGFGIVGWLLVAGALGYAFTQMPNEGEKAKQKKSTPKN